MINIISYILYLLLIGLHVTVLKELTQIYNVSINLPILTVLLVALYKDEISSVWYGFFAGVMVSVPMDSMIGWHGLIVAAIAITAHYFCQRLNLESLISKLLVIISGVFLHNLILQLYETTDDFIMQFLTRILLGAVYTTVISWIFFLIKDKKVTYQKFRQIF